MLVLQRVKFANTLAWNKSALQAELNLLNIFEILSARLSEPEVAENSDTIDKH